MGKRLVGNGRKERRKKEEITLKEFRSSVHILSLSLKGKL